MDNSKTDEIILLKAFRKQTGIALNQIYLNTKYHGMLREECLRTGLSVSLIIERVLHRHYEALGSGVKESEINPELLEKLKRPRKKKQGPKKPPRTCGGQTREGGRCMVKVRSGDEFCSVCGTRNTDYEDQQMEF